MEQYGWEVTVETMKGYLEMAELALGADGRWELGRGALRWLVRYQKQVPEKRLRGRRASVNAVIKRVKVSPAELAICGGDGSVTASSRDESR